MLQWRKHSFNSSSFTQAVTETYRQYTAPELRQRVFDHCGAGSAAWHLLKKNEKKIKF